MGEVVCRLFFDNFVRKTVEKIKRILFWRLRWEYLICRSLTGYCVLFYGFLVAFEDLDYKKVEDFKFIRLEFRRFLYFPFAKLYLTSNFVWINYSLIWDLSWIRNTSRDGKNVPKLSVIKRFASQLIFHFN